jgi:hypothetical protein
MRADSRVISLVLGQGEGLRGGEGAGGQKVCGNWQRCGSPNAIITIINVAIDNSIDVSPARARQSALALVAGVRWNVY